MLDVVFWTALGLLLYTYFGYPIVLVLLGRLKKFRPAFPETTSNWPSVSIILAAYNEESVIRKKIENLLSLDYPRDRLEIVIVSDASTDRTDSIVSEFINRGVTLITVMQRGGKTAALNYACPRTKGNVFIFTDANGLLDRGAIKALVRHFATARVSCVSGSVRYFDPKNGAAYQGESLYMRYDAWLKKLESVLGSLVGAYGGLFAFRREFFKPMDPMVPVDLEIPIQVLRQGGNVLYESYATCLEPASPRVGIEFRRHARISARTFYSMRYWFRCLLDPIRPFVLFQFISKKVLRWISPFFLLGLLVVPLVGQGSLFDLLRLGSGLFLVIAGIGALLSWFGNSRPLCSFALHFLIGNLAVACGLIAFLAGRQGPTWSVAREKPL